MLAEDADSLLSMLALLPNGAAQLAPYFRRLAESSDVFLQIGALCALLDGGDGGRDLLDRAIRASGQGAVRERAFQFFMRREQVGEARAVIAVPFDSVDTFAERRRELLLSEDQGALAELEASQFLRNGDPEHLAAAATHAEAWGGWRAALPWAARAVMLRPADGGLAFDLLRLLDGANQPVLMGRVLAIFERAGVFPTTRAIFQASSLLAAGQIAQAKRLLDGFQQPAPIKEIQAFIESLRGRVAEATADFRRAYDCYFRMNEMARPANVDPEAFIRLVNRSESWRFPELPPDPRAAGSFTLLGFPRSGTTLLQNALEAHSGIEAIEERHALNAAILFLETAGATREAGLKARHLYHEELDRHRKKSGATIVVDKVPILSAFANLLSNLLPDMRHLFVIRDPRDVVLSCFKQNFSPNLAVEHFRTFAGACHLYDFAMSRWFGIYGLDDPRVCYCRYDALVTNFADEMRRILGFLGADWDPAVLSFAERAEDRGERTPSYQKVRRGLSIGVQTAWRNYAFLFEGSDAGPLAKWIKFLGYEDAPA